MPAFGTVTHPARSGSEYPLTVNTPSGFPSDYPPGDLWWIGMRHGQIGQLPPGVTRATSVLCNPLVRMPWVLRGPDGTRIAPGDAGYPAWLADPMLMNGSSGGPNQGRLPMLDRLDRFDVWSRWITSALWLGWGLLAFEPDTAGAPLAGSVQVLHPSRLYRGDDGWALEVGDAVELVDERGMVAGSRLLLLRHGLPGGVLGWHRAQIDTANRLGQYASETFDTGVPSGVLSTDQPINQAQANQARSEWEARQQRRSIAVLGNGSRYQQVTMTPVDAELVALGRLTNEQIAHAFELPAWYLDASSDTGTYSNSTQWRQDLVDGPLSSWSARVEETIGSVLPWGWRLEIDFTKYTRPTTTTSSGGASSDDASVPDPA